MTVQAPTYRIGPGVRGEILRYSRQIDELGISFLNQIINSRIISVSLSVLRVLCGELNPPIPELKNGRQAAHGFLQSGGNGKQHAF
jgi:hypothetical protein